MGCGVDECNGRCGHTEGVGTVLESCSRPACDWLRLRLSCRRPWSCDALAHQVQALSGMISELRKPRDAGCHLTEAVFSMRYPAVDHWKR